LLVDIDQQLVGGRMAAFRYERLSLVELTLDLRRYP